ncbi:hypothetical protein DKT68_13840 [Micromonospora acroterricola]|uniref:Uncharacterized protein n=1 Tax=Micromonospora acroterricola TaxID=2202421 RepID=A0A317D2I6_9ACTN|nr:hypothetical protein [Micromonospora acroterricola]PWR09048.1 hypothetical protein DKT68_13840 [Micromonospora acroterricola]
MDRTDGVRDQRGDRLRGLPSGRWLSDSHVGGSDAALLHAVVELATNVIDHARTRSRIDASDSCSAHHGKLRRRWRRDALRAG